MENSVLTEIKEFVIKRFQAEYGWCGVAEGSNMIMMNTTDERGNDIKIDITVDTE